jgi:hypothetical protein
VRLALIKAAKFRFELLKLVLVRLALIKLAPPRLARLRLARLKSARIRLAPVRFAPLKSVLLRSASANWAPLRSHPTQLPVCRNCSRCAGLRACTDVVNQSGVMRMAVAKILVFSNLNLVFALDSSTKPSVLAPQVAH